MQNIQNIIEKVKAGDKDAFSALYRLFYPKIYSFLFRTLKDKTIADEITQDVFFRLWINRARIKSDLPFESYFFTISKNLMYSYYKRKKKEFNLESINIEKITETTTEKDVNFTELQQLIKKTIKTMPPQQQLVFKLSREEGLLNIEIAEKLGISKRTVEKHISNSINILRKIIGKNYMLFFI